MCVNEGRRFIFYFGIMFEYKEIEFMYKGVKKY